MPASLILDILLLLLLVGALVRGYRTGLLASLMIIAGLAAGGIAAALVVPLVGGWVPDPQWRTAATIGAALLLVLIGVSIGESIGASIRRGTRKSKLRVIDRTLGGVATTGATALVISMLAFSVGSIGIPLISPAIASSTVVRTIDSLTPDPVQSFLAQVRSAVVQDGLPRIVEAFTGTVPELPPAQTGTPALDAAARSVARITGNAYACGQNQSGTGFVIAADRVLTNAHVVAGVTQPVVELPDGNAYPGEIVYFDPVDDLAVIAVTGMTAAPLGITGNLAPGSPAVTDGYPFGGPFATGAAEVITVGTLGVADIYGQNPAPRQVYTLAAEVQHGESGGPLLSQEGLVAGVIFAKSENTPNVGYALAMEEVQPVAAQAGALDEHVSSGECVRG
ncbi:MAG: Colicin production protein [Cryobacterium sp.]|nr:Colicin production protein [Cryobacterium sp.]